MNNLVQLLKTRVYLWRKCTAWTSTGWNVQIIGTAASFTSSAVWLPVFAVPAPLLSWAEWRACTPAPRREGPGALMFANLTPPAAGWTRAEERRTRTLLSGCRRRTAGIISSPVCYCVQWVFEATDSIMNWKKWRTSNTHIILLSLFLPFLLSSMDTFKATVILGGGCCFSKNFIFLKKEGKNSHDQ